MTSFEWHWSICEMKLILKQPKQKVMICSADILIFSFNGSFLGKIEFPAEYIYLFCLIEFFSVTSIDPITMQVTLLYYLLTTVRDTYKTNEPLCKVLVIMINN